LNIVVWDTGIGIPSDRVGALFAPFIQADSSTTRRFGGSGLGLAISKQLVVAMGGAIDITSTSGHGTTFTLSIPLIVCTGSGTELSGETLAGFKILVVSSLERASAICCEQLRAAGAEAALAGSAQTAIKLYREQLADGAPPCALVVDQGLGDGEAGSLAHAIRACGAPPPAMILMRSLSNRTGKGNDAAFDRVVHKPVKPELLMRALSELRPSIATLTPASRVAGERGLNSGFRVLVVDDNAVNRMVCNHLLRKFAAVVSNSANGVEALAALRRSDFDVVLMDCQMPEMDGYEATRELRRFEPNHPNRDIPVIAVTANALATDREKCRAAGMNTYLSKPIDREQLEQVLTSVLAAPRDLRSGKARSIFL
jgi:two-component system sensor histidine kinase/response regulator